MQKRVTRFDVAININQNIKESKQGRSLFKSHYNNLLVESEGTLGSQPQILEFNYGPDNQRYRKYDLVNKEITLYANKDYELVFDVATRQIQERKYYLTSYMTITQDSQNRSKVNFMQKDRLGSTTQILDEQGNVLHTKGFDAFGKPQKGDWSDYSLFESKLDFTNVDENGGILSSVDISKRGFTDHEHLDEMQLIHMNGRIYDYNNGRFLSVDQFIQAPSSTQSMNPYTYIFNNPLSGIDPTGYTAQQEPKAVATAVLQKPRKQGFTLQSGLVFTGAHISTGDNIPEKNGKDSTGIGGPETKSSPNKNISDFGNLMDSLAVSRTELARIHKVQQKQMRECKAIKVRSCSGGITPKQIDEHRGNPSGTDPITNPDTVNPNFEGKVVISDSKIEITVNYSSKGDAKSNKRAIKNLRRECQLPLISDSCKLEFSSFCRYISGVMLPNESCGRS